MRLWKYLKEKMLPYVNRLAFADGNVTYKDLLAYGEEEIEKKKLKVLKVCEGESRNVLATEILRCIAEGNIAVPVTKEYGKKQYEFVREQVKRGGQGLDEVAMILFTSGTTGSPKGVMLSDENIIANLEYISTYFDLSGMKSICISRSPVHISALTGELFYGLCNGLTVYFYEEPFMPRRLAGFLRDKAIDVFCATPTLYLALAKYGHAENLRIRVGALSGERLTESTAKEIAEAFPDTAFYNVYGLTEHSPRVSALLPRDFVRKAGSVGKPIGQVSVEIRDGELVVKSPCVMKGYLNLEKETEEKIKGGLLYTGDMAHTDGEGYYYIDGRKDDMIIRAGVNLYPQEIEEEAKKCEGVEDCVAFGEADSRYGQSICLKYTGTAEPSRVRQYLSRKLPVHLQPNRILKAEALEKTASGKKIRR